MLPDESQNEAGQAVGAKIRAARRALKFTQRQLAGSDFSVSYISAIERGHIQPSLRALAILGTRLGLSALELFADQISDGKVYSSAWFKLPSRQEAIELVLLEAEVSIEQGAAQQAIDSLEQIETKNLKRRQQAQLQYLLGWAYLQTAQFEKSKNALSEAVRSAKDPDDFFLNLHILNMQGNLHAATHNDSEAIATYQRCLDMSASDQQCSPFFTIQVYTNLGECSIRLNQLGQAVEMFQRAAALTEDVANMEQLKSAYGRISRCYANAGEYEFAELNTGKYLHLYNQEARSRMRSELHYQLCHAVMQGDQEQARVFLEDALRRESGGEGGLSIASITLHLAMWFLAHKGLKKAKEYAQKAYEGARPFGETLIFAEAALLQGQIAFADSRYEEGDDCFAEGLAMLEHLGLREELAEGLVRYAQLLEDGGRPEEALSYWRKAVEMRRR
jgi:tetratricopeptide (TPR) repeat protein